MRRGGFCHCLFLTSPEESSQYIYITRRRLGMCLSSRGRQAAGQVSCCCSRMKNLLLLLLPDDDDKPIQSQCVQVLFSPYWNRCCCCICCVVGVTDFQRLRYDGGQESIFNSMDCVCLLPGKIIRRVLFFKRERISLLDSFFNHRGLQ